MYEDYLNAEDSALINNHSAFSMTAAAARAVRPLVITGPSGSGKSTLLKILFQNYPNCFAFSVSHTTRKPRPGEVEGKDYFFTDKSKMKADIERGHFLEHTEFSGNIYGTSLQAVQSIQDTGRICVLDLDLPGVHNIRASPLHKNERTRPRYVFVKPPSFEVLEQRLKGRGTETDDSLQKRLDRAVNDTKLAEKDPDLFDKIICNDVAERAAEELAAFLKPELDAVENSTR